jgi:glycosyltransferase involved in cell wall biosynthesis
MHTANCGHALDCDKWKNGCGKCPRLKKETKSYLIDGTHRSWVKMKKAFDGFDNLTVTSVSPWLMERAIESPILNGKNHTVVFNGLDTDVFHIYDTSELREKHGITNEKIVFHATPFFSDDKDHFKGGYYIIELAKMMSNVKFIVAGDHNSNISVPNNMILLGRVSNQVELAKYYSLADLTVITSKKETFSMIVAESMSCGTPAIGFMAGGPETIAIGEYSEFVEYGNAQALYEVASKFLNTNFDKEEISKKAYQVYSKAKMAEEYLRLYK